MSTSVTNAFIRSYEDDVKDEFQRMGSKLLNTIRFEPNVVGRSHDFFRIGKGTATTKARHGSITPMNQSHTAITATLEDFYAGDWVDRLDENKISINERQALARGGAAALGREIDNQVITKLDETTESTVTWSVGSAAAIENSLLNMAEAIYANDVPNDGEVYGLLTTKAWAYAMKVETFGNADFVGTDGQAFRDGPPSNQRMKDWLGVKWMQHTGLPNAGAASAKVFVYHRTAVGYASGQDITADIQWYSDKASHFVNHFMSGGAALIEDAGVIEGSVDDTASLPTS